MDDPNFDSSSFARLAQSILELNGNLDRLRELAESSGVPSPEHADWYALLKHKLIPQLNDKAFLIVAVMGGTNTGKSLVFNHLACESFSAVDHRASGTKHPVCLVPSMPGTMSFESILARHFDSFRLVPWSNPDQPLEANESHHLFWIEGKKVPERLLLLDTPDIDSDREVNWERARALRHSADVLIAVLTEQKYNDAAVRRFFREAGEAGKPIIVLFNMFDLESDTAHLPRWVERFCEETKTSPLSILVAPHDKQRAEKLEIPFYTTSGDGTLQGPVDLGAVLGELHFDEIKSQTLLGAIRILDDPDTGVRAYLRSVEASSRRFVEALETLENANETVVDWPGLPTSLLAEEIRAWWHTGRPGWSQNVNDTYRTVGKSLLWPVQKAIGYVSTRYFGTVASPVDPLQDFREQENQAVLRFVGKIIERLEKLAETDNPVLRRELLDLVGGEHRAALFDRAHTVLTSMEPVDAEFRETLRKHLSEWAGQNPQAVGWIRSLDNLTTVARPLITVTLALSGFALGAQVVGQMVGEVAVAGGVTAGGEAMIHAGSEGAKLSGARLLRTIQEEFVVARSKRFYAEFRNELWKDVVRRLRTGAEVVDSEPFRRCLDWHSPISASR